LVAVKTGLRTLTYRGLYYFQEVLELRDFRIPFVEVEDEKPLFGFSFKEAGVMTAGGMAAVLFGVLTWAVAKNPFIALAPALVVIPLAYYAARGSTVAVRGEKDTRMNVASYWAARLFFPRRPHHWSYFAKGDD